MKKGSGTVAGKALRVMLIAKFLNHGGVNEYAVRLAKTCKAGGASTELLYYRSPTRLTDSSEEGLRQSALLSGVAARISTALGSPILRIFRPSGYSDDSAPDLLSWILLPVLIRWSRRADLIIFTDEVFSPFALLALSLSPLPYLVVVHEGYEMKPRFLARLQRRLLHSAGAVISPSPRAAQMTAARTGIGVETLTITEPMSVDVRVEGKQIVLFDTRWTAARRPQLILDIAQLERRATYVVTGSFPTMPLESAFRDEVRARGLGERVILQVHPSPNETESLYSAALAYVRWAETDGMNAESGVGMGVLKALAVGCPVIVDKALGGSDLIEDGVHGFVTEARAEAIATRIAWLIDDPSLASRIRQNAQSLASRLSVGNQAPVLSEILARV